MEESISFIEKIKRDFLLGEKDIRTFSPLTLAFLGDAVFDLIIRSIIVQEANRSPAKLHHFNSKIVKASTQAALGEAIFELLEEEERAVYKRGRNAKSATSSKNASLADYRKATALEALFGYLYLKGEEERILFLVKTGLSLTGIIL